MPNQVRHDEGKENEKKTRHSVLDTESPELEGQQTDAESSLSAEGRFGMTIINP